MGHSDSALRFVRHVADFVSQHTKIDSQTGMRYRINYALTYVGMLLFCLNFDINVCEHVVLFED